ncbi:hypothetical protein B0H17DRAFT_1202225 [Mycena rosella]|uniref:Uncharacterized protein n=1 Tax=Mycena rosella TaxID=1033263 RepID=A0AAD7DEG1_MYCRO|nr:hypothetical protein B0H17DRAFT_1202225 [Mycena rosella]
MIPSRILASFDSSILQFPTRSLLLLAKDSYSKMTANFTIRWRISWRPACGIQCMKIRVGKLKPNARPERQPWPSSLADILLDDQGTAEILDTLLRWAVEPGHGQGVFNVIVGLAQFWEPLAVQLLRSPAVFPLATQHLQHSIDTFPGGIVARSNLWGLNVWSCTMFF